MPGLEYCVAPISLNNHAETEKIATEILSDPKTPEAVKSEAKLNRAKARAQQNKLTDVLKDLKEITIDTRTSIGAEAKFTLADVLFKLNRLNEAETEVLDFAKRYTVSVLAGKQFYRTGRCLYSERR